MPGPETKVLTPETIGAVRERLRAEGKTLVQCHGCFDIVHPGHVRYLRFARQQGDVLLVSVSADEVVGKGHDRPYIHEELRLENLAAIEFVDYVLLDHNTWAGPVLELVKPDVYVKGKEYETNRDPRFLKERQLVEDQGGRVIFSSGDVVFSSTFIINRYRERFDLDGERVRFFCTRNAITQEALEATVVAAIGKRVVVVGDPILDHYVHCDAPAVASESPILSVSPVSEQWYVGGAGLIAAQLAVLGAEVVFVTPFPDPEPHGDRLRAALERYGVRVAGVAAPRRPVYVKTRYLVEGHKVFKVDIGHQSPLASDAIEELTRLIREELATADAMVVTDFGYGLFGPAVTEAVHDACAARGVPYYADVSRRGHANIRKFKGPRLVTPTEDELRFSFGDTESGLSNLAFQYYQETGAERLILTMGNRGAILFHPPVDRRVQTEYMPSLSGSPIDAVGAGDVFLSGAVLADLAGATPELGLYLASALATLHVERLGNEPVPAIWLHEFLSGRTELAP